MTAHERHPPHPVGGTIEVITGPMFSGKTEELLRRMRRATLAKQTVCLIKPARDDRHGTTDVVSHDLRRQPAIAVERSEDIERHLNNLDRMPDVVVVDEVQFFDLEVVDVCNRLADAGIDPSSISFAVDYIPPAQLAYAEYVVQVLGDIGFNAELNTVPDFPSWATRVAGGEHQMTINNVWNWGDPVIGVHRTYLSTNNVGVIWTNNTGYNNADVDALLAQAGAEYDFDTRVDLYGQAQEIISQDVPIVYLTTPPFWQAFQPRVQNPPIGIWGQLGPMHEVWLAE